MRATDVQEYTHEGGLRGPCRRGKLETRGGIERFARIDCFDQT
jgi:hypothetical protein